MLPNLPEPSCEWWMKTYTIGDGYIERTIRVRPAAAEAFASSQ